MRVHLRQANVTTVLYNPIRAYHRHAYGLGYALSEPWLMAWADLWRRWARVDRPPDSFDWTGAWWVWRLDPRPGAPLPQAWLPGAERLYLDETALRRGEADPGRLALQRRVAGDFGMAWFQRGMLSYHAHHDAARAVAEIREAIRRDFVTPGSLNTLGVYLAADGRIAEAARRFREALVLDPHDASAQANLAELLARTAAGKR
jgi:tetratricopeptide (TPR) repeat protein